LEVIKATNMNYSKWFENFEAVIDVLLIIKHLKEMF